MGRLSVFALFLQTRQRATDHLALGRVGERRLGVFEVDPPRLLDLLVVIGDAAGRDLLRGGLAGGLRRHTASAPGGRAPRAFPAPERSRPPAREPPESGSPTRARTPRAGQGLPGWPSRARPRSRRHPPAPRV